LPCILSGFAFAARSRGLSHAVDQVEGSHQRMAPQHSGPRVAHHRFYFVAHRRLVAMDRALRTGRLAALKRALFKPLSGVGFERPAIRAQCCLHPVPVTAVNAYHSRQDFLFSRNSGWELSGYVSQAAFLQ